MAGSPSLPPTPPEVPVFQSSALGWALLDPRELCSLLTPLTLHTAVISQHWGGSGGTISH